MSLSEANLELSPEKHLYDGSFFPKIVNDF